MELESFQLGDVMIHDVPHGNSSDEPTLTASPVALDGSLQAYFRGKLLESLTTRGIDVVASDAGDGVVINAVARIVADAQALVTESQVIARHLDLIQNGSNPAGLVVVSAGRLDGRSAVALMKLEREQGIRFEINEHAGGATVDLELLRQLTLTNKTKVFKTALLTTSLQHRDGGVHGRASDNQRGQAEGRGVADFFLGTFLGCTLALNPGRTTQQFAAGITAFINEEADLTPQERGRFSLALLSYLDSNKLDVSSKEFLRDHISPEYRSAAQLHLEDRGIRADAVFQKDTTLIRFDKMRVQFDSGLFLAGPAAEFDSRVRFHDDNEQPGVDVTDKIRSIRGV